MAKGSRRNMLTYPLKVKKKIKEAKDSFSFVLEVPTKHRSLFIYTPAQFLTFQFQINGKKILRSYSLSSTPLLNEDLKTTVKRVKKGLISNYMIDVLKEGDTLLSRKPMGRFFKPPKDLKPKHYFLFAGGSGITPVFSILKSVLLSDLKNKVTLFYANRNEQSIIYKDLLQKWQNNYKKRLNILHILSQEDKKGDFIKGRISKSILKKYFPDNKELLHTHNLFYLCGPNGFMELIKTFLLEKKVKKEKIKTESFFTAVNKKAPISKLENNIQKTIPAVKKGTYIKGESVTDRAFPEKIKVLLQEQTIEIKVKEDIPILEQLLAEGLSPPFSCMAGSCMSCMAVLKKGLVRQEDLGILEAENIQKSEILTCQATPESSIVEIDYDNI